MIRGIYIAASGMLQEMIRNDTAASNLAYAGSAGYKKDIVVARTFSETLISCVNAVPASGRSLAGSQVIGTLGNGVAVDEIFTVHDPGKLEKSDNPLHMAVFGDGYFVVRTPAGERYTRNGMFTLDLEHHLVTAEGYPVMSAAGEPLCLGGGRVAINEEGQVFLDDTEVGELRLVNFAANDRLRKVGTKFFAATELSGEPEPARATIRQGYVEMSNVDHLLEMTELLSLMRTYEASQKAMQAQDQMLDKAVNDIARM